MRAPRRRRPTPRKSFISYILPLSLSIGLIVLVVLSVNLYANMQREKDRLALEQPIASLNVETEHVFSLLEGKRREIPKGLSDVHVGNDEGVATESDAHVLLKLANKDIVRMGSFSGVFVKWSEQKAILLGLEKGIFWLVSDEAKEKDKGTKIKSKKMMFDVKEKTTIAMEVHADEEVVRVLNGQIQAAVMDVTSTVRTITVGVGQELRVNDTVIAQLKKDPEYMPVTAISDSFKSDAWYTSNLQEDQSMLNYDYTVAQANGNSNNNTESAVLSTNSNVAQLNVNTNSDKKVSTPVTLDNVKRGDVVSASTITLKGTYDSATVKAVYVNGEKALLNTDTEKWTFRNFTVSKKGDTRIQVTYDTDEATGIKIAAVSISQKSELLSAPVLLAPKSKTISEASKLSGTVDETIVKVTVDGYPLQKFTAGSGTWQYSISPVIRNLKKGENTYEVLGYDKEGNATKPLQVKITYAPENGNSNISKAILNGTGSALPTE